MDLYKKWRDIYKNSLEVADRNLTKHMWKAAGI
jgi:autoinducer 2 (AI-2) kinase